MANYCRKQISAQQDTGSEDSCISLSQRMNNTSREDQDTRSYESDPRSTKVARKIKIHLKGPNQWNAGRRTQIISSCILFLQLAVSSYGQRQPPCACSPRVILFNVDFSGVCPPEDISKGSTTGIGTSFCSITEDAFPGLPPSLDLVPVQVTNINIFELGMDMTVMRQTFSTVDLVDGEPFSYLSFNSSDPSYDPIDDIPGGLQVDVKGKNKLGRDITNGFILKYTNRCDVVPFTPGDSIGWLNFTELTPPSGDTCPLYTDPPTTSPIPSVLPSSQPSKSLSETPSSTTTNVPSGRPSVSPAKKTTDKPTTTTSTSPSGVQTSDVPSSDHSTFPSITPTGTPSNKPNIVVSNSPSKSLTSSPTGIPTRLPTNSLSTASPTEKPTYTKSEIPTGSPSDLPTSESTEEPTMFSMSYSYKLATNEFLADLFLTNAGYRQPRVEHKTEVSKTSFLSEIYRANEDVQSSQQEQGDTDTYAETHKVKRKKGTRRILMNDDVGSIIS